MVEGEGPDYGHQTGYRQQPHHQQQQHHQQHYQEEDSRSEDSMMLAESKFFPGHPSITPGPFSPTFGRKDLFSQRKQREFIPENKKDDSYWDRRRRNNEAAKRSREKRRLNDMLLETRVLELTKDNHILKAQLTAIFEKYGIKGENMISMDQVLSTLPSNDQVLNFTKKRLGPMPRMTSDTPSPLPFLPINSNSNSSSINNNSLSANNNNNNNNIHNNNRTCSPSPTRSYRSRTPSPHRYSSPAPPSQVQSPYSDIRSYAETGHMYRRPQLHSGSSSSSSNSHLPHHPHHPQHHLHHLHQPHHYEDDQNDDKDSGLALNLSTDRAGSDGRSSASGSPPVPSSNIEREGSSSGDESGYPRSPNSGESTSLPHKLRFKSAVSEKEAVSSLLSLHQIAMIKREPVEHINHWMERIEAGHGAPHHPAAAHHPAAHHPHHPHNPHHQLGQAGNFFASLVPRETPSVLMARADMVSSAVTNNNSSSSTVASSSSIPVSSYAPAHLLHRNTEVVAAAAAAAAAANREKTAAAVGSSEPLLKRSRPNGGGGQENLTDEVARLTSEVATLKNILVNRMKEERSDEGED